MIICNELYSKVDGPILLEQLYRGKRKTLDKVKKFVFTRGGKMTRFMTLFFSNCGGTSELNHLWNSFMFNKYCKKDNSSIVMWKIGASGSQI